MGVLRPPYERSFGMLIKMLTLQAGPTGTREAGKVYEVPDKEA